jgi:gas vesicle protein
MSNNQDNGFFTFLSGIVLGVVGGSVLGLLFSPKSGDEIRQDFNTLVQSFPEKMSQELQSPKSFIEKTKCKIENRVDKVKEDRAASRLAKAKAEEMASSGYELN